LKEAYTDGRIAESTVRLVFGATAVGFVFVLALGLAGVTLLAGAPPPAPQPRRAVKGPGTLARRLATCR
jgi:hypothetical protein